MATIQQSILINAAAQAVYRQLTRFEDYPQFMEDVHSVQKTDDSHLHWTTKMANRPVEWDAEITEQESNRCIAWHNTSGPTNAGKVEVQELGPDSSQVIFTLNTEPEQVPGSMAGYTESDLAQRLRLDLARFKDLVEGPGESAGVQGVPQQGVLPSGIAGQQNDDTDTASSLRMRHVGDLPQDTTSEQHSSTATSDSAGKTSFPAAVRDSMGGVYQAPSVEPPAEQSSRQASAKNDSGNSSQERHANAPAGASATVSAAGGTDASAGARLSGSTGGPGGPGLRDQVDAAGVPGTPGGMLDGENVSPAAGADAAGGTGLGSAASAGDTRTGTGTSSGSGTALTGGGMSAARDAGT